MTTVPATNHATTSYTQAKFPYDIYVTPECLVKMNEYGRAAQPTEIGGLARIEINKETKNIFVIDIHIFPQHAESAYFEIPVEAMNQWTRDMIKAGRADELVEWKSIFHTHPVNMGPQMSGHDVDQIMNFAQEDDAFSFILSAAINADSSRMSMNYCCNFYGQKHVIRDIPVKVAVSSDRVAMVDRVTKYLKGLLGGKEALNDDDTFRLQSLVSSFLTKDVPTYFSEGRDAIRADIEQHVSAVVQQKTFQNKGRGYTPTVGDYAKGADQAKDRQEAARRIEQDATTAMIMDAVSRGDLSEAEGQAYIDDLTGALSDSEQGYLGYRQYVPAGGKYDNELKAINNLFALAFDRFDTQQPHREVSNKRAKKAARMWELRVVNLNKKLRKESDEGIGIYDLVKVDYSKIKSNQNNIKGSELDKIPHPVEMVIEDQTGFSFEVGGELFWAHELIKVQNFEDKMAEIKKEKVERGKLQQASQNLDQDVVDTKTDTTDMQLVQ